MNKIDKKIIYVLLIIIIISSVVLIYKINNKPKYNQEIYDEIYNEYNEIFSSITSENKDDNSKNINTNTTEKDIYIYKDKNNNTYKVIGKISIPKINIYYPIICETTDEYLKVAPTKLCGPEINEIGNFCIVGHNYKNNEFFSNLYKLENNDIIILTSNKGENTKYVVYNKYKVLEDDLSCLEQETEGKKEVTLITCTDNKKQRLILKARVY